jgi:HEAT repeat protein
MEKRITRRQFVQGTASLAAATVLSSCSRTLDLVNAGGTAPGAAPPKVLTDALRSPHPEIAADAARHLGDLGSRQAVAPLLDYVQQSHHYAKTAGFEALARIGDRSACPAIRPLVRKPGVYDDFFWYGRASVQVAAALCLLRLGDDSGADLLLESTESRDWALFTWFGPTALRLADRPEAARRVKARFTFDTVLPRTKSDPGQLVIVCDSLRILGGGEAREALVTMSGHRSRYLRARAAANLLAGWPEPDVVSRAVELAERDPTAFTRVKLSQALVAAGKDTEKYAQVVAEAADSTPDLFDRAAALDSLGSLGRQDHVPIAARQLKSDDAYVRLCAVEALDRIGSADAVAAVRQRANDPDLRVRMSVAACLAAHEGGTSHA